MSFLEAAAPFMPQLMCRMCVCVSEPPVWLWLGGR